MFYVIIISESIKFKLILLCEVFYMRIALFTETYSPAINGVVSHVKTLKEGLEKNNHEVLIVTAVPNIKKHNIENGVLYCPGKRIKKIYNYALAPPVSHKRFKYLKDFNPDLIHIHTEFGVGLFGLFISKILKKPLVYTLHTMYDEYIHYIAPGSLNPIFKKTAHKYTKFLAKSSTVIIGPSKKVEDYFKSCGMKKEVTIVPNCVELDRFNYYEIDKQKAQDLRKKYNLSQDQTVLCFCGRIAVEKDIHILLDFWKAKVSAEDNLKLVIIGDGPYKKVLEEKVSKLGLLKDVIFVGNVPRDDIPPYYAMCDLFITASLSEINSISMLESMALGIPVVHKLDKLNKGQVIDGVNGYIFEDADEMYNAIMDFKNKSESEKLEFKKSVRNSVEKFGIENLAKSIIEIYQKAIGNYPIQKFRKYKVSKVSKKSKVVKK